MNENKREILSVKTVVAIGISSAIYLVLAMFVSIPTPIANTSIQITYAFLAAVAVIFGPIAGLLTALIGHTLKDAMTYGVWWSWIIASGVVGLIIGFAQNKLGVEKGEFTLKSVIMFNIVQVVANVVAWGLVAPTLDILIYKEPLNKVYVQGALAGVSNIIAVAIVGTLLLFAYSKTITKTGSLDKE